MAPTRLYDCPGDTLEAKLLLAQRLRLDPPVAEGRLRRLGRFLRTLGRPVPRTLALADALPWLVPKVRPRIEYQRFAEATGQPAPEYRPLAGTLAVSLVVDMANQDLDLGAAQLTAWNADFDGLLQTARRNLLARGGGRAFQEVGRGRYRSPWQDGLDGSRILIPSLFSRLPLRGDPVAVLADRDTLLVVGSEDPEGLRWALAAGPGPLRLQNLHWDPFNG